MKGIEQGGKINPVDLEEIRRNFRQIARDIDPSSPSMKEVREARDQADQRLAEKGVTIILSRF
ncbi:MAG: hypothetical protein HYT08_03440 [Candidatus Levybacteria bacterium]|nr:hypothetical protein [Candidatus Levybacteria bacterium]